jgi:pimeloyl-ACP methyl ester carboxylesterase
MILQGYALQPRTYLGVAELLAQRCRVIIPDLFSGPGRWSAGRVEGDLVATADALGLDRVTLIGHSFGGALELCFATSHPDRVQEAVFVDTLAMSREWTLAAEAVHPMHLVWMATPRAAVDFVCSWTSYPLQLAEAAWWGFTSDRRQQVAFMAGSGIACHVMWADRDSLLNRADGELFAHDMGADFTVVSAPDANPVDHDWLYRHPRLAMHHLDKLHLAALAGG